MEQEELLEQLTAYFKRFPGIGLRQAKRFAHFIAQQEKQYIHRLTENITNLHHASKQCPQCFIHHQGNGEKCAICQRENTETLVIVEKDIDAHTLDTSTGNLIQAYYFILGGLVPIANSDQTAARIPQLIESIETYQPTEIIIALSVHPDADHTTRHLNDLLQQKFPEPTITTLGRGLSSGSELEYSDPETLINALTHRNPTSRKNTEEEA